MARRPRLFVADIPYHVVQRGNNKNSIFFSDKDYVYFLEVLQEAKIKHRCFIYSYCLNYIAGAVIVSGPLVKKVQL